MIFRILLKNESPKPKDEVASEWCERFEGLRTCQALMKNFNCCIMASRTIWLSYTIIGRYNPSQRTKLAPTWPYTSQPAQIVALKGHMLRLLDFYYASSVCSWSKLSSQHRTTSEFPMWLCISKAITSAHCMLLIDRLERWPAHCTTLWRQHKDQPYGSLHISLIPSP